MEDVSISKFRAQVVRAGSTPASPGFVVSEGQNPVDPSGSGQNHLPVTIATVSTGLSITESQVLGGAGTVGQYIRGDGSLADFPATTGGGSSVSYYLNGSVSQGTIGGVAYREVNRTPIFGAGTDITTSSNGYIANFITDAGDPNKLLIPAGNWNLETYFSANNGGGSPTFYVELYKYNGTTFTLIATSSGTPELIAFGTNINPYFTTLAVPETVLALTDRLALRYYVNTSGRTITLHTENGHLCQIITTFTTGLTALNGLTNQVQFFAVGTSGTDFAISSATDTHTFNLPTASATNRGALSSADWTTFNNKTSNLGTVTSVGLSSATSGVTIGSTPVTTSGTITLTIATASGSQNGLLSSTDWTTFNGKQNALTNPVTGTGTTNYLPKFTGSTTIGNSVIQDSGTTVTISSNLVAINGNGITEFKINNNTSEWEFYMPAGSTDLRLYRGTDKVTFFANGNVLVGTGSDAGFKLDVNGTGRFSSILQANGVFRQFVFAGYYADFGYNGTTYNFGSGEATDNVDYKIAGGGTFTSGGNFRWFTQTGGATPVQRFTITNTGRVQIDDSGSSSKLAVRGGNSTYPASSSASYTLSLNDPTSAAINVGGSLIFQGFKTSNTAVGNFAGIVGKKENGTGGNESGFLGFLTGDSGGAFSEKMRITSGGNVLIGTTTDAGYKTTIAGGGFGLLVLGGTTTSNLAILIRNSDNTVDWFKIRGGDAYTQAIGVYNNTSASTNNVVVTSDGGLQRFVASSLRFKDNITDWQGSGLDTILALKPKTYNYKKEYYKHTQREFLGLIAEEVYNVSPYLADFTNEDGSGQVENVRYSTIVVPLIKAIQELKQEIENLKKQ